MPYDRDYGDIFTIQDELTQHVVGAIEPEILMGEGRRAVQKPTGNLDAYECCMRGMWHHYQFTDKDLAAAERWHKRAIGLDPGFARAHMALARSLISRCYFGYSDDIRRDLSEACVEAERAVAIDARDPYGHYILFHAYMMSHRHKAALAKAQRVIDLSPNFALGHSALGWARIFIGHFSEALDPLHTALRLSPNDPLSFLFMRNLALAHYHLGNYEEAIHYSERALTTRRQHLTLIMMLACLGQLGRGEAAKALLPEIISMEPADVEHYWPVVFPYADPAHHAQLLEGLKKAGFPVERWAC